MAGCRVPAAPIETAAVGADPLVGKIPHNGSECATPPGRDAQERGWVIRVDGLASVAKPRSEQPQTGTEDQGHTSAN
jgi:hypothetical protein